MAKKVNENTWDEIQKNSQGDYFILKEDDGNVEVEMLSEHHIVESGDKDLADRIWDKDYPVNQVKALVDQETKILSLGWTTGPLLRKLIAQCKKNDISPSQLPGTKWNMQKVGQYEYNLEYLGRNEGVKNTPNDPNVSDNYRKIKLTVESLKDEPELAQGKSKESFLAIVGLKAQIPKAEVEKEFDSLKSNSVLKEQDGTIVIL
jgi:hypothetical protein